MARVLTNNFGLQYAVESSTGVLPASPQWRLLEPNTVSAFGRAITTVSRRPISQDRGRKKGTVVDRDSTVEFDGDTTLDSFSEFAEGFVFSEFANKEFDLRSGGASPVPPPATGTGYTIDAASALLAGKVQFTVAPGIATLVFATGYTTAANNGLKPITADLATSGTEITVSGLSAETPATKANLQVAGIRIATGDVTLTISGGTATLVSALEVTDWATLGWFAGMYIFFGSDDGTGAVVNAFDDTGTDDNFGFARITSISGATANLDKLDANLTATDTNTGDLDIMFGRFLRNVAVTATAADSEYLERSYQFEGSYPDLGGAGNDEFEYAIGNFANELALSLPLTDKSVVSWGFIGTNSDDIVVAGSRKTNAANAVGPVRVAAYGTSSDVASLTTDLITLAADVCFKSLTVTLRNNMSPEKCIGTEGATFVNTGLFEVNLEGQMLFTNKEITNAIAGNTTSTFALIMSNVDGAIALDIPALTFGGGDREYPIDQSVLVNVTGEAFNDPAGTIPDVSLGITLFPSVPTVRP